MSLIALVLVLMATALLMFLLFRPFRDDDKKWSEWEPHHHHQGNVFIFAVVRKYGNRIADSVPIGQIEDGDPQWNELRSRLWAEAVMRAVELNSERFFGA